MHSLIIIAPINCENERKYIFDVMLKDFLGIHYELIFEPRSNIVVKSKDISSPQLIIDDSFFQTSSKNWLKTTSLPLQPLISVNLNGLGLGESFDEELPIIYGKSSEGGSIIEILNDRICLGIDIFGSSFFLLSRYEETVKRTRDEHQRFPATASLAFQEGFLDRPIVNEYLVVLWACLKKLWPGLQRKQRKSRFILSHDVDVPLATGFTKTSRIVKSLAADIFLRKDMDLLLRRTRGWYYVSRGIFKYDVNNTFEMLMNISESLGIKSVFNFKSGGSSDYDEYYCISHPWVQSLLKTIFLRGHELGFHPSYNTFVDLEATKLEWDKLQQICESCGIHQHTWGGRQHYFRMQVPDTWQIWEDIGLHYDSTLGYPDEIGFRGGTCYEYPTYNVKKRIPLALREKPLIAMDGSLFVYMILSEGESTKRLIKLKKQCEKYQGDFTLLWHSNRIASHANLRYYTELLHALI